MAALCILPNSSVSGALIELDMPDQSSKGKFLISETSMYRAVGYQVPGSVCVD